MRLGVRVGAVGALDGARDGCWLGDRVEAVGLNIRGVRERMVSPNRMLYPFGSLLEDCVLSLIFAPRTWLWEHLTAYAMGAR